MKKNKFYDENIPHFMVGIVDAVLIVAVILFATLGVEILLNWCMP